MLTPNEIDETIDVINTIAERAHQNADHATSDICKALAANTYALTLIAEILAEQRNQ
jgi:4-hydroxy-3-methylbut-2-enyl diphosphate reductase IspH